MTRRIPPAEATQHPWWAIIDPALLTLPHPDDVGGLDICPECGADVGEPCVLTAAESDTCIGHRSDELHESRTDYRAAVTAADVAHVVTGPFFSRDAAAAHLDAKRHNFSDRARVWCLSGHESSDWRAFCEEASHG